MYSSLGTLGFHQLHLLNNVRDFYIEKYRLTAFSYIEFSYISLAMRFLNRFLSVLEKNPVKLCGLILLVGFLS
jgi:hypothetical protein